MASSCSAQAAEHDELNFFASDEEESEFEGFDFDEVPLRFFARGDFDRESDNEEDANLFLHDDSDEEDSGSESDDDEELVWSEILTPQTELPFDQRTGPVRNLPADKKAIDFFELFFTDRLYGLIVRETNRYARQEQQRLGKDLQWRELSIESILRFLHFVDNNSVLPWAEDRDQLFKIRQVIEELVRQFQQNYILTREISIDETMVKFKGRKFFRQFLPSKPIRFGFKLFTLAESKSGYIWNFEVYTGRKGEAEQNQTKNVVVRITNPLQDKGYRLFTDNFYTESFFLL